MVASQIKSKDVLFQVSLFLLGGSQWARWDAYQSINPDHFATINGKLWSRGHSLAPLSSNDLCILTDKTTCWHDDNLIRVFFPVHRSL